MTDKIILELTLDELKLIDKYVELNDETQSVFDKIKYAYPQLKMTLYREGQYAVVSYNDTTYYRLKGETTCFTWWIQKGVSANHPMPTLTMISDAETERLLEGLYYNHIEVKKEKEMIRQNLKTSLEELANGDVRPIDDVIEEAKEEQTKTPCEIAYKEWWGEYPTNTWQSDVNRWEAFQMGYNASYKQKAQEQGKRVHNEMEEVVRDSVKWCEEHKNENPLDWLTPKTPEETEQSLKEAFRKAQQTEKWKELQRKIDEEDNDKNFKNSLDLIKEWGENNKPPTLKELLWEWWEDIFTVDSDLDADASIDVLVDRIDKEFIPPSSEKNGYVWEKCLKIMRDKLR